MRAAADAGMVLARRATAVMKIQAREKETASCGLTPTSMLVRSR